MVEQELQLGGPRVKSFMDVGSGAGKVLAHVLAATNSEVLVRGVEVEVNRYYLGTVALRTAHSAGTIEARRCLVEHADAFGTAIDLSCNIIYAFDQAFPDADMARFANKFNASPAALVLVSYHAPQALAFFGFDVVPLAKIRELAMHGSNSGKVSRNLDRHSVFDPFPLLGSDGLRVQEAADRREQRHRRWSRPQRRCLALCRGERHAQLLLNDAGGKAQALRAAAAVQGRLVLGTLQRVGCAAASAVAGCAAVAAAPSLVRI